MDSTCQESGIQKNIQQKKKNDGATLACPVTKERRQPSRETKKSSLSSTTSLCWCNRQLDAILGAHDERVLLNPRLHVSGFNGLKGLQHACCYVRGLVEGKLFCECQSCILQEGKYLERGRTGVKVSEKTEKKKKVEEKGGRKRKKENEGKTHDQCKSSDPH